MLKRTLLEDIGLLEHSQITITNRLLEKLTQNKCTVVTCDSSHMTIGLLQPLEGHTAPVSILKLLSNFWHGDL